MTDHRLLIIGQGSIGQRHAKISRDLGYRTATVSRRPGVGDYAAISEAIPAFNPTAVVIASATADHHRDFDALRAVRFEGPVMVEKPLDRSVVAAEGMAGGAVRVACNLRFSPVIDRLREILALLEEPVISAQFHVGQYLPDWRQGRDWQKSYSADPARGGGVLRDLSHELDLALWLFGPWSRLTALGGALSDLPMAADDLWQITAVQRDCPVTSIHLNGLDHGPRRQIRVNSTHQTITADLIGGEIDVNGQRERFSAGFADTYPTQLKAFVEGTRAGVLSKWNEGMQVMRMIEAVERAQDRQCWVWEGQA